MDLVKYRYKRLTILFGWRELCMPSKEILKPFFLPVICLPPCPSRFRKLLALILAPRSGVQTRELNFRTFHRFSFEDLTVLESRAGIGKISICRDVTENDDTLFRTSDFINDRANEVRELA